MTTAAQTFYGVSTLHDFTRENVLAGGVIKINPALVTLTDGLIGKVEPQAIQQQIWEQVNDLLSYRIRTFHVDLNFDDYRGFGRERLPNNLAVFTPPFLERLNALIRSGGGFLNLHLLTDAPGHHLAPLTPGAVCFQLEAVTDPGTLERLIGRITDLGGLRQPRD